MIVEYIRYEITEPEPFLRGYEAARAALDTSPHCLSYELSRCTEEPTSFILRIEWDSADGHLHGFRKSAEFAVFLGAVRPFIENIREMRHYALTSIAARKAPRVASDRATLSDTTATNKSKEAMP
jgi:quinol monooxygenase YgiN